MDNENTPPKDNQFSQKKKLGSTSVQRRRGNYCCKEPTEKCEKRSEKLQTPYSLSNYILRYRAKLRSELQTRQLRDVSLVLFKWVTNLEGGSLNQPSRMRYHSVYCVLSFQRLRPSNPKGATFTWQILYFKFTGFNSNIDLLTPTEIQKYS